MIWGISEEVFIMVIKGKNLYEQKKDDFYLKEKQFLYLNLKNNSEMDSRIIHLTPPDLFWIKALSLYGIYHTLAKDPIPSPRRFIVLPDNSIYHSSEILLALKKLGLFPKSNDEAIKYAALISYCMCRNDHILRKGGLLFGDCESPIQLLNKESIGKLPQKILKIIDDPKSEQKDNNYIVTLYVNSFESYKYRRPKFWSISKMSIEIGRDTYRIIRKKKIITRPF